MRLYIRYRNVYVWSQFKFGNSGSLFRKNVSFISDLFIEFDLSILYSHFKVIRFLFLLTNHTMLTGRISIYIIMKLLLIVFNNI